MHILYEFENLRHERFCESYIRYLSYKTIPTNCQTDEMCLSVSYNKFSFGGVCLSYTSFCNQKQSYYILHSTTHPAKWNLFKMEFIAIHNVHMSIFRCNHRTQQLILSFLEKSQKVLGDTIGRRLRMKIEKRTSLYGKKFWTNFWKKIILTGMQVDETLK